jgi:predicted ATPase/GAF domain-containing protein/ABC-type transporter Mla MlaB component
MQSVSANDQSSPLPGYASAVLVDEGYETTVHRAVRTEDGARVILKVTKSEYPTARELARLRREFGILRALDVPRVPRAVALHEHGRGLALVMSDLGSRTLRSLLEERRLTVGEVLALAVSLSDVLASVHQARVIHKDVTPRNIVVDEATREASLIDFGISARLTYESPRLASPDALEGTLAYVAPEQTGRINRVVDLRADLYSMGAVLYEMLTGAPPFTSDDPTELVHAHIARDPVRPSERAPEVPAPLSDIVMTLLAKMPEDRYQSDAGLRADLAECARQWESSGTVEPFPLRRHDRATDLRQAQRLYGRERDVARLMEAFERARERGPELVLISGYSGVGKSALVSEIHKPIARQGGYFVSGKFDQMSRDVPLAPVVQVFRELIRQILTEPPAALAAWKRELTRALGANGRILTDLVPELELVLGPQPEVAALGAVEAKNRWSFAVQSFLGVFAAPDHPLVIFLDDLQWVDPASLKLIEMILRDTQSKHMLLLGAYRDNEVDAGHPLRTLLDDLHKEGLRSTDIHLGPLDEAMVSELVADTLTMRAADALPLSRVVFEKTQGNPFFVHQFLDELHKQGLLSADAAAGGWRWDIDAIQRAEVTDNVADLMIGRLKRLAPATQRALMLASCIGFKFTLRALATISEKTLGEAAAELWEALRAGLVLPMDSDYRLVEFDADTASSRGSSERVVVDFEVGYRFLHDRVLQAAYALAPDESKQQTHLTIGRLLRSQSGGVPRDAELLEIVHHLSRGAAGMTEPEERLDLAELCLRAGRKAKASTAYDAAASYLRTGAALLSDEDWERHYDVCFPLHAEAAECVYMSGDVARAEALFDALLPRVKTSLEQAGLYLLRSRMLASVGRFADAVKAGNEGLTALGRPLPLDGDLAAIFVEEEPQITEALRERGVASLASAEEATDPVIRAAEQLHAALVLPSFYAHQSLFGVLTVRRLKLILERGPTPDSSGAYANYGSLLAGFMGRVPEGMAVGKVALALNERLPNIRVTSLVKVAYATFAFMQAPMREVTPYYFEACEAGLQSGDFLTLGVACFLTSMYVFAAGYQLEEVLENTEKNLALCRRTRENLPIVVLTIVRQSILNLMGKTLSPSTLSSDDFDEEAFLATLDEVNHGNALFHMHVMRLRQRCLYGDFEGALAAADAAEQKAVFAPGDMHMTELAFYGAVALLRLPPAEDPAEAERRAALLRRYKRRMDELAAGSPRSFEHKRVLLEAEEARLAGDVAKAIPLYEQAMRLAHEDRFPQVEGLASELCASLYRGLGAEAAAGAYLARAYRAYAHWGAVAKTDAIELAHGDILPAEGSGRRTRTATAAKRTGTATSSLLERTSVGSLRDAALVVRAAQTISSEMDLPKVIERLMTIVLENSGAQSGALILSNEGRLVIKATFKTDPSEVKADEDLLVDDCPHIARSVVVYAARTLEFVVLHDVTEPGRFSEDPHIRGGGPQSILCLPLMHQARLLGVLYLESASMKGVFNAVRVELLALLSSQAATAIESAQLLARVRKAKEEVLRANERLEAEVAHRTEQLRRTNQKLSGANEQLERELEERERIEKERSALQEQVIAATRARLAELSTPLMPITEGIMVMPLIGTVDRERAELVMQVALEGAQRHRARMVILDVTGIKHIDAHAAAALFRVASALRMLGAEAVLSGISPDVATTLVGLGVDLTSIATTGTLQGAMAYALARAGGPGGRAAFGRR